MNPKHLLFVVAFFASLKILSQSVVSQTFAYTGAMQSFTIPTCAMSLTVEVYGASGGFQGTISPTPGTYGGMVSAVLSGTPGAVLNLFVGGKGTDAGMLAAPWGYGGYNGGGDGVTVSSAPCTNNDHSAGGGGASDVRLNGVALTDRIIVAGGGGGMAGNFPGGAGGGGGLCEGECYVGFGGQTGFHYTQLPPPDPFWDGSCSGGASPTQSTIAGKGAGVTAPGSGGYLWGGWLLSEPGSLGQGGNSNSDGFTSGGGGGGGYYGGGGGGSIYEHNPCGTCCNSYYNGSGGGGSSYVRTDLFTKPTFSAGVVPGNGSIVIRYSNAPQIMTSHPALCGSSSGSATLTVPGLSSYLWSNGSTSSSIVVSPTITTTYSVTGVSSVGTCSVASAITITVAPAFNLSITSNPPTLCAGGFATLTASGASSYTWMNMSATTPTALVKTNGTTLYQVRGSTNGCTFQKTYTLVVSPTVAPVYTIVPPVCMSDAYTLTSTGATSYTWFTNSGWSSNLSTATLVNATTNSVIVNLRIAAASGCTAQTIFNIGPVTNNSIVATATLNCGISPLTATLGVLGASSSYSYNWSGPSNFASTVQSPTLSSVSIGIYSVIVTDNSGCSSFSKVSVGSFLGGSISPLTNVGCVGQSIGLAVNYPSNPSAPITTYNWTGPNSFTSMQAHPIIAPLSMSHAGVYTVTASNAVGCSVSATLQLSVYPAFTLTATASGPVCPGQSVTLAAGGATNYHWTGPGLGLGVPGQNLTISQLTPSLAGTYTLTGATSNGCRSGTLVTISLFPFPTISATGGSTCPGSNLQLTASSQSVTGFLWQGPNGFSSSQQNPVVAGMSINSAGVYTVTSTNSFGCSASATVAVALSSGIFVNAYSSNVCTGQNLSLNATANGAVSYTWTGPSGFSSNLQNPVLNNVANPANNGNYTVTVSDAQGCQGTAQTYVVVMPSKDVFVASAALCAGQDWHLHANADCSSSYTWTGPGGFSSNLKNPVISNVGLNNSGTYTLVTGSAGACSSGSATANLLVMPNPVVTAAGGSVCVGSSISITTTASNNYAYYWTGPSSFTSTAQSPTIAIAGFSNHGVYYLHVNDVNSGCSSSATATVAVLPIPSLTLQATTVKCEGSSHTLTCLNANSGTYSWVGPNNFSSNLQNPVVANLSTLSSGGYTVTITDGQTGCAATGSTAIMVLAAPVINVQDTSLCSGNTITLTANGIANYSYNWAGPGGYSSTQANPVLTNLNVNTSGAYTVSAHSNTTGCTSVRVFTLSVFPTPIVSVTGATVCNNQSVMLTPTGTNVNTYFWTGPGGYTSNVQNPVLVNPLPGNYTLSTSNSYGCSSDTVVTISVGAPPSLAVLGNTNVCVGGVISFSANNSVSYLWMGPNNFSSTSQSFSISNVTNLSAGVYTVEVTNAFCSVSNTFQVQVYSSALSVSGPTVLCGGSSAVFVAITNVPGTFTWSGSGGDYGNSPTLILNDILPSQSGSYTLTSLTTNSCLTQVVFSLSVLDCSGISEEATEATNVKVYPNPAFELLTVETPESMQGWIYDANGNYVMSLSLKEGKNVFSIESLAGGMYLLLVKIQDRPLIFKFIKTN